jgi:hypothetical protein
MPAFQASDASSILAARTKVITHLNDGLLLWYEPADRTRIVNVPSTFDACSCSAA